MAFFYCTCGQRHHTLEEKDACIAAAKREAASTRKLALLALLSLGAIILTVTLVTHQIMNGDWRCAFKRCVTVIDGR